MAITRADVTAILKHDLSDGDLDAAITTANLIVSEDLSGSGHSSSRLDEIRKYLAAHFATFKSPQGRLTDLAVDDIRQRFSGKFAMGLKASHYGQMAVSLDTTGTLAELADPRPVATIDPQYLDPDTEIWG